MNNSFAYSPDSNNGIEIHGNQEVIQPSLLISTEQAAVLDTMSAVDTESLLSKDIPFYILNDRTSLITMRTNLNRIQANISSRDRPKPQYSIMIAEKKELLLNLLSTKLKIVNSRLAEMSGEQTPLVKNGQPAANDEPYEGDLDSAFNEGVTVSELPPEDAARFFPDTISGAQTENTAVDIDLSKPTPKPATPVDLEI